MERRAILLVFALGLLSLVAACTSLDDGTFLGYSARPRFASDIRTIRVPIFQNKTPIRDVEFQLTEAVIKQIEARTPWKVVTEGADVELTGCVVNVAKRVILQNTQNEVREAELTYAVQISWRDLRTGQDLTKPDGPLLPEPLLPSGVVATPPVLAIPGQCASVIIQRSSSFIPELGQSYASAEKKVVEDLANQIVNVMELPW